MRAKALVIVPCVLVTLLAGCLTVFADVVPNGAFIFGVFAVMSWLVALGLWLVVLFTEHRSLFLIGPVALVFGFALLTVTDVADDLAFDLSKGDLAHHAQTLKPGRVGFYPLEKPEIDGGVVRMPVKDCGFIFAQCGFVYAPNGMPANFGSDYESADWQHIEGPWYSYYIVEP